MFNIWSNICCSKSVSQSIRSNLVAIVYNVNKKTRDSDMRLPGDTERCSNGPLVAWWWIAEQWFPRCRTINAQQTTMTQTYVAGALLTGLMCWFQRFSRGGTRQQWLTDLLYYYSVAMAHSSSARRGNLGLRDMYWRSLRPTVHPSETLHSDFWLKRSLIVWHKKMVGTSSFFSQQCYKIGFMFSVAFFFLGIIFSLHRKIA